MAKPTLTTIMSNTEPAAQAPTVPAQHGPVKEKKEWEVTTIRFKPETMKRLKRVALDLDEPMQVMIEKALSRYLAEKGVGPIKGLRA